jgi:subtilisin family serine protease
MPIEKRLTEVLKIVRQGIAVPIIVSVNIPITNEIQSHLQSLGMTVTDVSGLAPQIYGKATEEVIEAVASLPFVATVHYDEPITMQMPAPTAGPDILITPSEAAEGMNAGDLYDAGFTGKGVSIAIIDTGCDVNHPFLSSAVTKTASMVPDEDADDHCGHGTHCAGIALGRHTSIMGKEMHGVAPDAGLIVVKVLDKSGSGQTSWVCKGIEKAVELGADIISMSLGSVWDGGGVGPDAQIVNTVAIEHNIPVVVAAGNSFIPGTVGSPGSAAGAITVGSVAFASPLKFTVSTFSSKGPLSNLQTKPNVAGFGGNLWNPKETIFSSIAGSLADGKDYAGLMGTSMATPGVAGAIALLLQAGLPYDRLQFESLLAYTGQPMRHLQTNLDGWGTMDVAAIYRNINNPLIPNTEAMKPLMMLETLAGLPVSLPALLSPERQARTAVRLPYMT